MTTWEDRKRDQEWDEAQDSKSRIKREHIQRGGNLDELSPDFEIVLRPDFEVLRDAARFLRTSSDRRAIKFKLADELIELAKESEASLDELRGR